MSDMPNNGKTYTEVVLEFTKTLGESERRQTIHNTAVLEALARGDEKFKATDDKIAVCYKTLSEDIDDNKKRADDHDDEFKEVRRNQKWLGLGEGGMMALLVWLGLK